MPNRQEWRPWASIQLPDDLCSLSDISPETRKLWDRVGGLPQLLDPSSCFTPRPPPFEDVWIELVRGCKSHQYDVTYKGELLGDDRESEKEELYALALLHTQQPIAREACGIKVMNIWEHGLQQRMILPEGLSKVNLGGSCMFSCHITPPGTISPFHHDFGKAQLVYCFGTKHWVVIPGLDENIRHYINESVHDNVLKRFLTHQPKGAILIKHTSEKVLFLPPGTIHAVETEEGAIFIGGEFPVIECLDVMPWLIRAQLQVFETSQEILKQDLNNYTEVVKETLRLRRDCLTILALKSWLEVYPVLLSTLRRLQGKSKNDLKDWTKDLFRLWGAWTKTTEIKACPCQPGKVLDEMGAHFRKEHLRQL
ncbi:uncharacterized protein PAC_05592 [Phialocephala subalpina]|uniref:JmjC domain-containing protein n=1 Tax=Phialocephala subalpina TaxID=576137 RepID=A0A1L7WSF1_9HELO|nr:uncharacterized protein PAC_05592 [Phialocephala subalpina]